MAQFDTLLIDGGFAIGSTDYAEHYPNDWRNTRIVVTVIAGGYAIPMPPLAWQEALLEVCGPQGWDTSSGMLVPPNCLSWMSSRIIQTSSTSSPCKKGWRWPRIGKINGMLHWHRAPAPRPLAAGWR